MDMYRIMPSQHVCKLRKVSFVRVRGLAQLQFATFRPPVYAQRMDLTYFDINVLDETDRVLSKRRRA